MAGPSLQLGVSAAGQETLAKLNAELASLRTNLSALKAGKPDLSNLTGANDQLKLLRKDMANSGAGLQTAFADLAETIKGGFAKVAGEQQAGAARQRSLAQQERAQNQALYDQAIQQRAQFTATELAQIRAGGVQIVEADRQRIAAIAAVQSQANRTLGQVSNPSRQLVSTAADSEIGAAYAQHQKQMADQAAAAKAAAWIEADRLANLEIERAQVQGFAGFAAIEKQLAAQRARSVAEANKAAASGISAADSFADTSNATRAAAIARAGQLAAADGVFKQMATANFAQTAAQIAASKEAAWTLYESSSAAEMGKISLQTARGFGAMEREGNRIRLAAAQEADAALASGLAAADALAVAVADKAAKDEAAIRAAAARTAAAFEAEALRVKTAEARYNAAGTGTRNSAQLGARSQLDQGIPLAAVKQNFGETAVAAAQAATSIDSLRTAHKQAAAAAEEHVPKLKLISTGMNEAHAAARGLASGFGAMFLTYGSVLPLLAGAALSNAFVQTVKVGSEVEQTLAVIKEQSEETSQAIDNLRARLLALSSNGPQGPREVAEAMKALSLAGLTAAQVSTTVKDALTLSIVGEMPAQKAAESLVAISTAYGYSAGQFSRVNDVIAKTAAISMSSVQGMTESFRVSSVVAQQYGVSLEDMAMGLALVNNIGIRNQAAGTAMTQMYAGLAGTTKKGTDALKQFHVSTMETIDGVTRMRPLIAIYEDLSKSLAKYTGEQKIAAVAAAFNNRGQRAEGAIMSAMFKPATDEQGKNITDESGKIVTQAEQTFKQINESYGFAIIAMAALSLTAENQMKSVAAAFQGSLVQAFQDLEPTILSVSKTLRDTFNSSEFKAGLTGIVEAVGNLTVFLAQNLSTILDVAKAWLVWKGALIGAAVFSAIGASLSALSGIMVGLRGATLLAATGFTALQASMGLIGLVLGGIAAAWLYYKSTTATSVTSAADIAKLKTDEIIKALEAESDKIDARNQLLREGVSAREADIRMAGVQAQSDMQQAQLKASDEQKAQRESKQRELDAARADLSSRPANPSFSEDLFLNATHNREVAQRRVNQLEGEYNTTLRAGVRLTESQIQQKKDLQLAQDVLRASQMEANRLDKPSQPVTPSGNSQFKIDKDRSLQAAGDKLGALKLIYTAEEAELKKHYDQINKIETIRHTSGQTSDIQYTLEQTAREQAQFATRIAHLQGYISERESALKVLQSRPDKNKDQRAIGEEEKELIHLRSLQSQLLLAQQITQEEQKARDFKLEADTSKFITQQMAALVLANQEADVKKSILTLTLDQQQVENARLAAAGKYTDEINKQKVQLTAAQQYLKDLQTKPNTSAANDFGAGSAEKIEAASDAVDQLQGSVTRLEQSAKTAGTFAAQSIVDRLKPQWQTLIDGWSNVQQRMTEMYDATVSAVISTGETAFTRLATTGKLSATEMLNSIRDILIKNMYQSTVAPAMAALGKQVAEGIFGARPQATVDPAALAAQRTAGALDTMNNLGVQPATTAFARLIEAVGEASMALLNMRQGASGGGGFDTLARLLGGGGDSGLTVDRGGYGIGSGSGVVGLPTAGGAALGAVFGFAKGSPFTNRTFSQPTRFSFGGGAAIGEMGEAGPEAVMPLKRGADGSLGVAYTGGGQQAAPVSVVVENHSGGQVKTRETKKGDGSREIRFIIDAAVDEVANSIAGGGKVGSAIESTYGSNRAAGLPRR